MKGGAQFRGVSQDQDLKFKDKHKKLRGSMNFPKKFDHKIRRSAFKLEPLRPWIFRRVTELLEMEDEVVQEYAYSLVESAGDVLDAKDLQISLQGFLFAHSATFVSDLWDLLMDAEKRTDGIPLVIHQEREVQAKLERERRDQEQSNRRVIPMRRRSRSRSRSPHVKRERRSRSPSPSQRRRRRRSRSPSPRFSRRRSRSPR